MLSDHIALYDRRNVRKKIRLIIMIRQQHDDLKHENTGEKLENKTEKKAKMRHRENIK